MRAASTSIITLLVAISATTGALADQYGGAPASAPPQPESVTCSRDCAALAAAKPGSTVRVYGRGLDQVTKVVFLGATGAADDRSIRAAKARSHTVYVKVPADAIGGPLVLVNGDGTQSAPTAPIEIDRGPTPLAAPGTTPPVDAKVEVRKAFFFGRRLATLDYLVKGASPEQVAISLLRAGTQTVVASWPARVVQPGSAENIRWDGMDATTRTAAVQGRYEFRIYTSAPGARSAQASKPTAARSFEFLDHQFPVHGPHNYGGKEGRFGAGRTGHIHEGQDVMAACGTPLVAARGGIVRFRGYQYNAGNYLVINGQATGVDNAYMHLRGPALFKKGARVRTGDLIGYVGQTGDATACHLHFEEWTAPGWYAGGHAIDPLADLRAWDQFS